MKRIISICLMAMCIVCFAFGVAACNRFRTDSWTEKQLSDDLDSLMFSLDGVIYTLPVHFSELEANGWTPYDTDPRSGSAYRFAIDTLEPGDFAAWELILGNQNIIARLNNISEEVLPLRESYITSVSVLYEVYHAQLILPGNIMLGSTYEDVIAVYGEPSSEHYTSERTQLFYFSYQFDLVINIDHESNQVTMISIWYLIE